MARKVDQIGYRGEEGQQQWAAIGQWRVSWDNLVG
jgi:hypothetical protein